MTSTAPLTAPEQEAVAAAEQRLAGCKTPPFYLVRLRSQMLSLARQFFSVQHQFPLLDELSDLPKVPQCVKWHAEAEQRTLEIEALFSPQPPETEKTSLYVGLSSAKFTSVSLDNSTTSVSDSLHAASFAKRCEGAVTFTLQHYDPDTALFLLELFQTALEGSRTSIMRELGLSSFNTVELTPPALAAGGAQRIMRCSLHCAFVAHIEMTTTEQSLPLRQVSSNLGMSSS